MQANTFTITLEEAYMITPSVKQFVFTPATPLNYLPGQFITIHIQHDGKILRRSYSLANAPSSKNQLEFAAGFVENGPSTELLFHLKPGDTLNTTGPFGRLTLKDEDPVRYIFVATSTGVTPYHAMLPALKKRLDANPNLHVVLLQGVQNRHDLLYHDTFLAFAQQTPRVTYRAQLSRENPEALRANEHAGYVQTAYPELNLNPEEDIVYLCGNPGMVDESFSDLKDRGFAIQRIVREKYISR
ncbi:MAG: ferredoxin--NADP reductase [Legionellaceae bacterium]|nr:ferredoxin--NADP reductase [Legionellaceae bacterium]